LILVVFLKNKKSSSFKLSQEDKLFLCKPKPPEFISIYYKVKTKSSEKLRSLTRNSVSCLLKSLVFFKFHQYTIWYKDGVDELNGKFDSVGKIVLFFFFCGLFHAHFGYGSERKQPRLIPPHNRINTPFLTKGESGFCFIQYDVDSLKYYWDGFGADGGIAVYMDPAICGLENTYPFKITNVHFYLYDPGGFVWPVEIKVSIVNADTALDTLTQNRLRPGSRSHYKTFIIPQDSAYDPVSHPNPINLYLDTVFCVTSPFFLEITYTGTTDSVYPSLVMSDTTDRPAPNLNWRYAHGKYYEWDTAWVNPLPGRAIMRVTGYPQAIDCDACWYWNAKVSSAPSGMPDFDQYQFGSDSLALCGPTAVANCLVWLNAIPSITKPDSLIRFLSHDFYTNPSDSGGTFLDSIKMSLDSLFVHYDLNLYDTIIPNPTFSEIADSLEDSANVVLLLGLWQNIADTLYRMGGHYVSLAGVCKLDSLIAISDPTLDNAESGAEGRILPTHYPHPDDHVLHNTKGFVSHDVYLSDTLSMSSKTVLWRLKDYHGGSLRWLSQFEGQNFQVGQQLYAHSYDSTKAVYAVVEYAIMIYPKLPEDCWYWKPETPSAPSGMPDFDQYQFGADSMLCAPTAVANCLVWLNALPSITDPDSLIQLLSNDFHTNPSDSGGTFVDSIKAGLDSLFINYSLNLYDNVLQNPSYSEITDSLENSANIVLLLGLWQNIDDTTYRIGGHFVSMAGVCKLDSLVAISDPAVDNAESGAMGRVLPVHNVHPNDHILHNDSGYVSQDEYVSDTLSVGPYTGLWRLKDYSGGNLPWLSQFEGQNFQPGQMQYAHSYDSTTAVYAVVEYAILIGQTPSLVIEEEAETPKAFELFQCYPNPFNPSTIIRFTVHCPLHTTLIIYNLLGQKVRTLVDEPKAVGNYKVIWNGKDDRGKDLSSGIYFYQLKTRELSETKKMVLLK